MSEIDVAVIGGGVVGLACALALAESGASVCVIERESRPGRGMSTHNSGVIHAGIYYPAGSLKARLCVDGRERLYEFCERHAVPYQRCGKLLVAGHEGEIGELEALLARGVANGAASLEMVDAKFVRRQEPHVSAVAAVWSPDTGIVETEALIGVLGRLCREQDVAMLIGTAAHWRRRIERRGRAGHAAREVHCGNRRERRRPVRRRRLRDARREALPNQAVPR